MSTGGSVILLEFDRAEALVRTLRELREAGYERLEVYSPYPSEEIDKLLPGRPTPIGWIVLFAALAGGVGAYGLQWFAAHDYALNVGGRPLHSWPAFVPVTFELTVLSAAIVGVLTLLWLARLPRLDHALEGELAFVRATQDRFVLCVDAADRRFTRVGFDKIAAAAAALSVTEHVV
jgi:hypothetical protein